MIPTGPSGFSREQKILNFIFINYGKRFIDVVAEWVKVWKMRFLSE